jgi:hypothetical protein
MGGRWSPPIFRNLADQLTLFLPPKKVTLKTTHGQNQPMCM